MYLNRSEPASLLYRRQNTIFSNTSVSIIFLYIFYISYNQTLFALGTPEEVDIYVKRLIQEVGEGGGFILNSGCGVSYDEKIENVKAMVDAGKRYGIYK